MSGVSRKSRGWRTSVTTELLGGSMNDFSLLTANHLTHLKVVMLALPCVTLVAAFGLVQSALQQAF
jgi:BarA-like signal transduction histidine kinase